MKRIIRLMAVMGLLFSLSACSFLGTSEKEPTEIENLFPKSFNIRNYEKIYNKLVNARNKVKNQLKWRKGAGHSPDSL